MFEARLDAAAQTIQSHLGTVLGKFRTDLPVVQAMAHATHGGKCLRGFLVLESARLHGIGAAQALWPASAIEALHAYSLVHDDLPCMDDDDMRRGQPTVHRKWDEATAVLAGDALQTLAFELLADPLNGLDADVRGALALGLAQSGGAEGMVLGQALDMGADRQEVPLGIDDITALQQGKTGALIVWSATAGACMARVDPGPLAAYAHALGLAFQIADDVLDVTGNSATVGKAVGKDQRAGKATFVSLLGVEEARNRARALVEEACDSLAQYGAAADTLRAAAHFVVRRAH